MNPDRPGGPAVLLSLDRDQRGPGFAADRCACAQGVARIPSDNERGHAPALVGGVRPWAA